MSTTFDIELKMLRTDHWKSLQTIFVLNLGFSPSGPSEQMMKESASHHIYQRSPPQRPEDNLYEYCALAQEICGFGDDFVGSYGSEGVFFERCQIFRLGPFLWSSGWSGKLPEPPWTHLGSSWIISGSFKTFHTFVIFDMIFATSKRCLTHTFQTSKVIEIKNGGQIQILRIELVMGEIIKTKIYV